MKQIDFQSLRSGDRAMVIGFLEGDTFCKRKLMTFGLIPGADFSVYKVAPFGDPVYIKFKTMRLSLRKNEGQCLILEKF